MRLYWLPTKLRQAGLTVVVVPGWRTRGAEFTATPQVVVGHHTASNPGSNMPSLPILRDGRPDLPGPLCQVGLARDGTAYVVAAGKANHAGPGRWRDVTTSSLTVGIEAENSGVGEAWPQCQLDAYDVCAAVLLAELGQSSQMFCGHKEWAVPTGRKIDPAGIDLDAMRARIARLLEAGVKVRPGLSDDDIRRIWAYRIGDPDDDLADRADKAILNALRRIKALEAEVAAIRKGRP